MIIDGHNDLVLHAWRGVPTDHLDLDAALAAGFAGGFFALYVPSPRVAGSRRRFRTRCRWRSRFRTPRQSRVAEELFAALCALPVARATSVDDFQEGRVTAIVHFEGADALAPDLSDLESWYERGLRSVGLVWSRSNAFAHGVPFEFPASPDTGPGLTAAGLDLVRACNRLGILVDLSHLNEAGFWDVARTSSAPLVATHSNAHALCPSTRNLTDAQLDEVARTDGVVGVNFACGFLREPTAATSSRRRCRRSCGTSTTSSSGWGSTTSPSARTSTARSSLRSSAASRVSRSSSRRSPTAATTTRRSRS